MSLINRRVRITAKIAPVLNTIGKEGTIVSYRKNGLYPFTIKLDEVGETQLQNKTIYLAVKTGEMILI